ncbi:hypothetical protein RUM43_011334 [Polyplax serrata]|uniref:Uncharacterized protein n=1 Tax=Polyplax serrata TaxID=468196 RepID=A0AAN8S7U2_POLSC
MRTVRVVNSGSLADLRTTVLHRNREIKRAKPPPGGCFQVALDVSWAPISLRATTTVACMQKSNMDHMVAEFLFSLSLKWEKENRRCNAHPSHLPTTSSDVKCEKHVEEDRDSEVDWVDDVCVQRMWPISNPIISAETVKRMRKRWDKLNVKDKEKNRPQKKMVACPTLLHSDNAL